MKLTLLLALLTLGLVYSPTHSNLVIASGENNPSAHPRAHVDDGSGNAAFAAFGLAPSLPAFTETKLTAADAGIDDQFGRAVAVRGDFAVVGAPNDSGSGIASGAAYVFIRN